MTNTSMSIRDLSLVGKRLNILHALGIKMRFFFAPVHLRDPRTNTKVRIPPLDFVSLSNYVPIISLNRSQVVDWCDAILRLRAYFKNRIATTALLYLRSNFNPIPRGFDLLGNIEPFYQYYLSLMELIEAGIKYSIKIEDTDAESVTEFKILITNSTSHVLHDVSLNANVTNIGSMQKFNSEKFNTLEIDETIEYGFPLVRGLWRISAAAANNFESATGFLLN